MTSFPIDEDGLLKFYPYELPRLRVCPSSKVQSLGKPDVAEGVTNIGLAFHELMAEATYVGSHNAPIEEIAGKYGVDEGELNDLFTRFNFDPEGGEAEVRVRWRDETGHFTLSGKIDWLKIEDRIADVTDWKTTWRVDQDPEPWSDPQTQAYGVGLLQQREGEIDRVRLTKAYPRYGERGWTAAFEIDSTNRESVESHLLDIMHAACEQEERPVNERRYTLSHFCDYCPGRVDCPGLKHAFATAVNGVQEVRLRKKDGKLGKRTKTVLDVPINWDTAPAAVELVKLLRKAANAISNETKAFVDSVGPIPLPDEPGKYIAVLPQVRSATVNETNILNAAHELGGTDEEIRERIAVIADCINHVRKQMPPTVQEQLDIYDEAKVEELL